MAYYSPYTVKDDIETLFDCIRKLRILPDCDDIVTTLTSKLEELFVDAPEKDLAKQIGSYTYYSNGLIKLKGSGLGVIASPWTPTVSVKEKKSKHLFQSLDNLKMYQMRVYTNYPVRKKCDLVSLLKRIEAEKLLPDNILKEVSYHEVADILDGMLDLFNINLNRYYRRYTSEKVFKYLTDENCKNMLLIYDTLDAGKTKDKAWSNNSLKEQIDDYINLSCNSYIGFDLEMYFKKYDCPYYSYMQDHQLNLKENYITILLDMYNAIYKVQDDNFRKTMIKLKIIEEGYVPNINIKDDIIDVEVVD